MDIDRYGQCFYVITATDKTSSDCGRKCIWLCESKSEVDELIKLLKRNKYFINIKNTGLKYVREYDE